MTQQDRDRLAACIRDREVRDGVAIEISSRERERPEADLDLGGAREPRAAVTEQKGDAVPRDVGVSKIEPTVAIEVGRDDRARPCV